MDTSKLSANWKSLQKKLSLEKKASSTPATSSLKRKIWNTTSMNSAPSKRVSHTRSKSQSSQKIDPGVSVTPHLPERPSTAVSSYESLPLPKRNEGISPTALPGKYIALDCEMVGVGPPPHADHQLARVSLVNWYGEQVYDSFVRPQLPVTDYRTAVSGIRPADLRQGRPFHEVRADVSVFLQGRILVGHWLKNDLECLQIQHPRSNIRDTAKLPKFRTMVGGGNVKLRDITRRVLGLEIQTGEHDSVEDARTAMLLFRAEKEAFEGEQHSLKPKPAQAMMNGNATENQHDKPRRKKKRR
jgi:RNA exonuclease 4